MRIHFYGRLADALGREVELASAAPCSVAELRELLAADHPHAAEALRNRARACIDDELVSDSRIVSPGEAVEFFPPVSGG